MATWDKEQIIFGLYDSVTGSAHTTSHTVKMVRQGDDLADGISCSQKSVATNMWGPNSDLDDDYNYHIYIDSVLSAVYPSRKATPMISY